MKSSHSNPKTQKSLKMNEEVKDVNKSTELNLAKNKSFTLSVGG